MAGYVASGWQVRFSLRYNTKERHIAKLGQIVKWSKLL
jgi:hypothetical protein